eukprot:294724_1
MPRTTNNTPETTSNDEFDDSNDNNSRTRRRKKEKTGNEQSIENETNSIRDEETESDNDNTMDIDDDNDVPQIPPTPHTVSGLKAMTVKELRTKFKKHNISQKGLRKKK